MNVFLQSLVLAFGASVAFARPTVRQADAEAPSAAAQDAPNTLVKLRSGELLWGAILTHDPDGIAVRRLDNGGLARLTWAFLDPAQAEDLRLTWGYVDSGAEEFFVDALRLRLADGSEVVGVVDGRTDEHLFLRTATARLPLPLSSLVGAPTSVRVPALDVYTKEELVQQKAQALAERLALTDQRGALANLELAEFAEGVFDFPAALDYYRRAAALDPEYRPDFVAAAIERAQQKAELQEQVDGLAEIDRLAARKLYGQAVERINAFPELYPGSPLLPDWNRLRERVAKHQERDVRAEVARLWYANTVKLTRNAVRKLESYEAVVGYLDGALVDELEKSVAEALEPLAPGITPEEVRRLWEARERGKMRTASYGSGTWLLGEERALAEIDPEAKKAEDAAPKSARQSERDAFQERVERYLRNQEVARRAQAGGGAEEDGLETPEQFWRAESSGNRSQWALAYFVENSGVFQVVRSRLSNCRECGGTGARQVLFTGSAIAGDSAGTRLFRCTLCHGIGRVRRLSYR